MAIEELMWIEKDFDFFLVFFYCQLCPLSIPFFEEATAKAYLEGHRHNSYHKRRLELST